jgi:AraC family transcriptional activator of pobA
MKENEIKLFELSDSLYGVLVAKMRPEFVTREIEADMTTPHRHDYYSLVLIEAGMVNMTIDFRSVDLTSSSMLILRPGQVHQTNTWKDVSGWIMFFDAKKVDQHIRFAIEQSLQNIIVVNLDRSAVSGLIYLCEELLLAIENRLPGKFHQHFLQSLLNAFLYRSVDIIHLQEAEAVNQYPVRAIEITRLFHQLVKEHYKIMKRPADYADRMNISVSYLNDTLKVVTGFSCTYLIAQELIGEAQRLLFYTNLSVKEIAFELGYNDYKYFIRQFGKHSHQTPTDFRKQLASTGNTKPV